MLDRGEAGGSVALAGCRDDGGSEFSRHFGGVVGRIIVRDDDALHPVLRQIVDHAPDRAFLVPGGNDDSDARRPNRGAMRRSSFAKPKRSTTMPIITITIMTATTWATSPYSRPD